MKNSLFNDIIASYEHLINHMGVLIEVSGYRTDYIAKKMGLTTANFSVKKNRKSFTLEEIKKIAQIIDNEDVEDYLLLQEMKNRQADETVTHEELYKSMGWS